MVKQKQQSQQLKVREYVAANPTATAREVAAATGVTLQGVYNHQYRIRQAVKAKAAVKSASTAKATIAAAAMRKAKREAKKALTPEALESLNKEFEEGRARTWVWPDGPDKQGGFRYVDTPLPITMHEPVNPLVHVDGGTATVEYIEERGLGFHLGNVVQYISNAATKGTTQGLDDLHKAQWWLTRAIEKNVSVASKR